MRILVFENGEPGRLTDIAGENVRAELEELLGGPVMSRILTGNLHLVVREDGREKSLPLRYTQYRTGSQPKPIYGNAVVVKFDCAGRAHDLSNKEARAMCSFWVKPVEVSA